MNNTFFLWLKGMTMSGNNLPYNNRGHYNVSSTGSSRYGWIRLMERWMDVESENLRQTDGLMSYGLIKY